MSNKYIKNAIPKDVAFKLCDEIRQQYLGKWYTFKGIQCWGCTTYSKDDPTKMCFSNHPELYGCNLVNDRFDRKHQLRTSKPIGT